MTDVVFAPAARADLARIRRWIARDDPVRALSFIEELETRALALSDFPLRNPVAYDTPLGSIHKLVHGRYHVLYRVLPDRVEIMQFRHSAQDMPSFD